jgi:hypothetical protein
MQNLDLPLERLENLILAADVRLGGTDYANDHIWELSLHSGEPPALALSTTFGLRARGFRLFPRFVEGDFERIDPAGFDIPPSLHRLYPNLAVLSYAPFPGIDVRADYWVPDSHQVAGSLEISNRGVTARKITLDWIALLAPGVEGHRMIAEQIDGAWVLTGETDGLAPLVFVTGGASPGIGPYPALTLELNLLPGTIGRVAWVQAACAQPAESLAAARRLALRNRDAELARIEVMNQAQVEIATGNPEWDLLFTLGQQAALSLLVGPGAGLPHPSLVLTRQPDQGSSLRGTGSDYNHLWNGQPAQETAYLCSLILPAAPAAAENLLRNFLAAQDSQSGAIDWKPGLAGQRSRLLATPILADLAWQIYQHTESRAFLEEVFDPLRRFVQAWFDPQHDRDQDGIPEWDYISQLGFEEHPVFASLHPASQGAEISAAESPALCAMLYRECQALLHMAARLERSEPGPALSARADALRAAVEACWDDASATYRYRDRDSHRSPAGLELARRQGPGSLPVKGRLSEPVRLVVRLQTRQEQTLRPALSITGQSKDNSAVETLSVPLDRWRWFPGGGSVTSQQVFSAVRRVEILGIGPQDQVTVSAVDYRCEDLSLLLPLWAALPTAPRARQLIDKTLADPARYWLPFGLPACPGGPADPQLAACQAAPLYWNTLVGRGLLAYGFRSRAAELVSHLMAGIAATFRQTGAFRKRYSARNGLGSGEPNPLDGLPPLGLFLDALGVGLISGWKVRLEGHNPFPWPVQVRYRGLTILRQADFTTLTFPDGQTMMVDDPAPCTISLGSAAR